MLLVVGTKLQGIITRMCLDTSDKSHVVRGTLLVRPSDHFFWFGQPKLLLHLMHFILFQVIVSLSRTLIETSLNLIFVKSKPYSIQFLSMIGFVLWVLQNSFQLAFFTWTWVSIVEMSPT